MSDYCILQRGDRLPSVGVLQVLLNRAGMPVKQDGVFGPRTQAALVAFQEGQKLNPDGIADQSTWNELTVGDELPLLDFVDVFHDQVYEKALDLVRAGAKPLMMGGMSNGIQQMAQDLSSYRGLFLLRIIGHGCAGVQAISMGKGGWFEQVPGKKKPEYHSYDHWHSSINYKNVGGLPAAMLARIFGRYGSVELHGCHVAAGATGRQFVAALANLIGVPVSAGIGSQRTPFRFDTTTFTALPHGKVLSEWCAHLPALPNASMPQA